MDTDTPSRDDAWEQRDAFDPTAWAADDTILLQPSNLPIARVQRAWERKPASPLARGRFRVGGGKVSKRVLMPSSGMRDGSAQTAAVFAAGLASPQCPTKRLRVDAGAGAHVSRWEARQSPVRKIVTRSALDDRLLELPLLDEEEGGGLVEDEGEVTYEVLGEDGRVLELVGEEGVEANHEWSDVEDEDEDEEERPEEVVDATVMQSGDAVPEPQPVDPSSSSAAFQESESASLDPDSGTPLHKPQTITALQSPSAAYHKPSENIATWTPILASLAMQPQPPPEPIISPSKPALAAQIHTSLPEGFVTPAKQPQRRKLGSRTSRVVSDSRRRTLPVQFAPEVPVMPAVRAAADAVDEDSEGVEGGDEILGETMDSAEAMADHGDGAESSDDEVSVEPLRNAEVLVEERDGDEEMDMATTTAEAEVEMGEEEWEDVEDEAVPNELPVSISESVDDADIMDVPEKAMDDEKHTSPFSEIEAPCTLDTAMSEPSSAVVAEPVPSIEEIERADITLRRSPRRKSTSPIKPKTSTSAIDKPHHIAFTPLRRFSPFVDLRHTSTGTPDNHSTPMKDDAAASPISPRASSAPLEEPQIQPRRTDRPRISDDTAFLHAFLKQAEERKGRGVDESGRRLSVTEKESVSNRRDSDTVRQALAASPDEQQQQRPDLGLLGLRDADSPSPKKQQAAADFDGAEGIVVGSEAAQEILEDAAELASASGTRARRSGRGKRKPQVYSSSASSGTGPAKISIRGLSGSGDVVKKDEVPVLTRSNTKKNKGGAVLPKARLVKLALESVAEASGSDAAPPATSGDHEMDDVDAVDKVGKKNKKGMSLHWAEELVSFYQGGEREVEMGDEEEVEEVRMPWERGADFDPTVEVPVPASEIPSKPKGGRVRKLKAPARTAGTSAKVKVDAAKPEDSVAEASVAAPIDKPAASKPRRSRIATPAAKGVIKGDLLPADLAVAPLAAPPSVSEDAKTAAAPPSKKRTAGVSRLPPPRTIASLAPAPTAATTSISTGGKENLTLTSSPPKKRSRTTTASTALSNAKAASALAPPKLDFGQAMTELKPVAMGGMDGVVESVPGLASPAKKVGSRRAAMFGSSVQSTRAVDAAPMMSLSSPAKKRGGRRLGG
ncbi:hypothetical protein LTR17_001361 [Elasticomyces elasticus]|nr:hypothetical protein LTR17_001361 [Elasticomyces elasticus]